MATMRQVRTTLAKLGLKLDEEVSFWSRESGGSATIDAIGRTSIDTDCRGHFVYDYTLSAPAFWDLVIEEANSIANTLSPCPHIQGDCDFHDHEDTE